MIRQELEDHYNLIQRLRKIDEIIATLHDAALPKASVITGMPRTSGVYDKVGNLAIEIADMEQRRQEIIDELEQSMPKIEECISFATDDQTRLILRMRFIHGLSWKEIAAYCGRYVSPESVKSAYYRFCRTHLAPI